ncbi:hypothetical protein NOVOSPHI9U_10277 [Novosphingobium sp. 9U]|nr:hypothetical protein NOVOSPHI9U_10277 [Novosphingobium sp. 9U]
MAGASITPSLAAVSAAEPDHHQLAPQHEPERGDRTHVAGVRVGERRLAQIKDWPERSRVNGVACLGCDHLHICILTPQ